MNRRDFLLGSMGSVLPWKTFLNQHFAGEQTPNVFSNPREWIYRRRDSSIMDRDAKAADYNYPEKVPGVEFYRLRSPVTMVSRYPTWEYEPEKNTVFSIRREPNEAADQRIIKEQNDELEKYHIQVDMLQFNPNPREDIHDWELLEQNYLAVPSERPFFILYEHHFGTRYKFERKALKEGRYVADLSLPHNRDVLFEDIKLLVDRFVLPFGSRYVTHDGRAFVYFWASQIYKNAKPVFEELKRRFPVFLIGAEDPFHINKSPDAIRRVSSMDGFIPYALYRAGWYVGRYPVMRHEYFWNMIRWSEFLRKHSRHAKLFGTLQVAFDDSAVPWSDRVPMYPNSVDQVYELASIIRSSMIGPRSSMIEPYNLGFVLDGAVHAVYDEYFEGAAIEQSRPPEAFFSNYDIRLALSGTTRLEIMSHSF